MGCGSSSDTFNPDRVDLSHFRILKAIGRGGFGKVSAIEDKKTKKILALKRLRKAQIITDNLNFQLVWSERKVLQLVKSPFVVSVINAFQSPTELFLVMPYVAGGDLRFHLNEAAQQSGRPKFERSVAYFYAKEILCGLEDCHKANVIIRDIKPENLLIAETGSICLIDFGLAVILDDDAFKGLKDIKAGTKLYMSPEMHSMGHGNDSKSSDSIVGHGGSSLMRATSRASHNINGIPKDAYSFEVDIWSWAVVFYEMLHGYTPWRDHIRDEVIPWGDLKLKESLSETEKSFFREVFQVNREERLGGDGKWDKIKKHAIFKGTSWEDIHSQRYTSKNGPPFIPDLQRTYFTGEAAGLDELVDEAPPKIPEDQQYRFDGWEYNVNVLPEGHRKRESLTQSKNLGTQVERGNSQNQL